MSGYTPVFRTVFEGSLCGQYPDTAAWLFMLALADKNGHVDKTPQYISAVTGMPVETLLQCIERFMQPDPISRTADDDGRRLIPIDPDRSWGWIVVNHGKYREKARLAAKSAREVESGKNAERMQCRGQTAADRRSPPLTDPSNANANTLREAQQPAAVPRSRGSRIPEDWKPDMTGTSVPQDFDRDTESAKFRDYWKSAPKGVKLDWQATWRNWVRRAVEGGTYSKRSGGVKWQ